jgi:uncharacterized protein YkwD
VTTAPPRPLASKLAAAVLALLAAAAACVVLAPPASAGPVEDEARLYELTNQARAEHGLPPLQYDSAATGVARAWAQELARSGQLRHNPNVVAQVDAHVTNQWTRVGENVGFGPNVDVIQTAYMNSSGHRHNILGDFNRVGVGVAHGADGRVWTTVVFIKGPALAAPPPPSVPASTFAPLPSAQAFASQQFTDLLARAADPAGLMTWTAAVSSVASSPSAMVAALVGSPEATMTVEPVNRLYKAYFRRNPDAEGLRYWVGRLRSGTSLGQISGGFTQSAEFRSQYGALDDRGFVDLVYRNVLGRTADAAGAAYWLQQLAAGRVDRGGVMVNFSESEEYRFATWAWNDVVQVYIGLLRRSPDQGALDHWVPRVRSGGSAALAELAATILSSSEYRSRF